MRKNILLAIIAVLILGGIGWTLYSTGNASPQKDGKESQSIPAATTAITPTTVITTQVQEEKQASSVGKYISYAPTLLTNGHNVIFFAASWCPTCRSLDKQLNSSKQQIPPALTILKADYDKEKELKKKYGVTYQHTLVQVDNSGNMIKKWSGSQDLSEILKEVRQ